MLHVTDRASQRPVTDRAHHGQGTAKSQATCRAKRRLGVSSARHKDVTGRTIHRQAGQVTGKQGKSNMYNKTQTRHT